MKLSKIREAFNNCQQVTFDQTESGQLFLNVENQWAKAQVYLQGAHITSYQPVSGDECLWLSDCAVYEKDKAIRGGIPICWPWFGPNVSNPLLPQHGFARTAEFDLLKIDELSNKTILSFYIASNEKTLNLWPTDFKLTVKIEIGAELCVTLETQIFGEKPVSFSQAIHSYFLVGDISETSISGLEPSQYHNKLTDCLVEQLEPLKFTAETDSIYLNPSNHLTLVEGSKPILIVEQSGADSTVVWNPWEDKSKEMIDFPNQGYQKMVCIEAANTRQQQLVPGQVFWLSQKIIPVTSPLFETKDKS